MLHSPIILHCFQLYSTLGTACPSVLHCSILSFNNLLNSTQYIFREHRIVHVNVGWVALTGYAAMDVEGLQLSSLIDEDLDPRGMERWQQSLKCLTSDDCSTSQGSVIVNLKRRLFQRPSFYRSGSRSSRSTSSDGTSITRNVSSNSSLILEGTTQFEGPAMFPAPFKSELTQVELTPVPIGTKHFAVLCISQRS